MAQILLLRLEGPMQSWGEHAKWDHRDCALTPTKSGIVGLLACALGIERGDARIARLNAAVRIAVRADRPGRLMTDFQTIHAETARGEAICNTEGKPRGDTITTWRAYLQDASFLAAVEADEALLRALEAALRAPKWPICLGRRSCVPARPVLIGLTDAYDGLESAMRHEKIALRADERHAEEFVVYELDSEDGTGYARSDERVGGGRVFAMRRVRRGHVRKGDLPCI